jgi:hypothetical protein
MKDFPTSYRHGSGAEVHLDPTRLLLIFSRPPARREFEAHLAEQGLVIETKEPGTPDRPGEEINNTDTHFWVRTAAGTAIDDDACGRIETGLGRHFLCVSPVYRAHGVAGTGGYFSPLANVLLVNRPAYEVEPFGLKEMVEKSRYLGGYHYYTVMNPRERHAFRLRDALNAAVPGAAVEFETMPRERPLAAVPNDPLFVRQWDMTRIGTPAGWDIATGAGVTICILDQGCDLTHPDLSLAGLGVNLGTMAPPGSPTGPHGTCCAGIAAGVLNDSIGVAGVAGGARVLPAAFQLWTDVECAAGINWAAANGARVISMSFGVYAPGDPFGPQGWNFAIIDPAIANAVNVIGLVLCAATGNENTSLVNRYPARNPLVIACGGSDQRDNRKSPASPDGEMWGANWAPGISVVAPAVLCTTTDIQGAGGYNAAGGPVNFGGVVYPVGGDLAGNYLYVFDGTSSATPHVAGFAALLGSAYPTLTNLQIRDIIERTAEKVGAAPYAEVPGFVNGVRTPELGYGRINVFRGLDFADVMIRDWPGDAGTEPSAPPGGDFTDFSDIVVRPHDDHVFIPAIPAMANQIQAGRRNHIYVRAQNLGPHAARNLVVDVRLTPGTGVSFAYPADWTAVDATHLRPNPVVQTFATVPTGASVIAEFSISEHEADTMAAWAAGGAQVCLLAVVSADNDYAFASAPGGAGLVRARNNLAERTLTILPAEKRREREEKEEKEGEDDCPCCPVVELTLNIKVNGKETKVEMRDRR